ncbi:hypothetical protein PIB30_087906 [Stylosanthes scabra]|uniref:Uncharacterized protein n=1 Tax=Stylosanthes scabra TaxID=79078 RepID=A0ABU6QTI3_9FABA|nr:hypothetical protein [Stylosanthes scabra]
MCQISGAPSENVSHPESSSSSGSRARHSKIRPFRPPRDKAYSAPSASVENCHPPNRCPNHRNQPEVDNTDTENDDYISDADEMASFDDHIDNLFGNHDAEQQNKGKKKARHRLVGCRTDISFGRGSRRSKKEDYFAKVGKVLERQ